MRQEKTVIVEGLQERLEKAEAYFLVSYMGLTVEKKEEFTKKLVDTNSTIQVHKNKLIQKAAPAIADAKLVGGTAVVCTHGEAGDCAKVIREFAKENEEVSFKLAFVDGEVLIGKDAAQVADLPTKDQARSMLLSVLNAAPTQLARVLNNTAAQIVNVLNNYKESQ